MRNDAATPLHGADFEPLTEAEQQAFFEAVLERAIEAERRAEPFEQDISLLGKTLRLRFAGAAARDALLPALAHLSVEPAGAPDALIHIWDTQESGVGIPPAPCDVACFTHRGDIWTMLSRRIRSAYQPGESTLSLFDFGRSEGVFWARSAADLPPWSKAAPLRALLSWWVTAQGGQLLHGSAFGTEAGGILLTGKGGVGKSTTALQCLASGYRYVGDDFVAVTITGIPTVHSLYCTAKVMPAAMQHFAGFDLRLPWGAPDEKAIAFLYPEWKDRITRSLPLKAVLTPEFAGARTTTIGPAARDCVREAATFTTVSLLPHAGQETVAFVDTLLETLPAGLLRLGSDVECVPDAIASFLQHPPERIVPAPRPIVRERRSPLVSVVIPVFNGARFVADAVGSVMAQDYAPLDIVLVDDASLDGIDEAVAALPHPVRLVKQPHGGPAAARNTGIRHAAGEFIAFLDVDDLWPAGKLRASLDALLADDDLDVVSGQAQLSRLDPATGDWIFVGDPKDSFPYSISAAVFRRRAFEQVGLFDADLRFAEDTDWFTRAREAGRPIRWLDRPTVTVRRHDSNMTFGRGSDDLTPARLLKNLLDRRRARAS